MKRHAQSIYFNIGMACLMFIKMFGELELYAIPMEFLKDLIVLVLVCQFNLIASYHKLRSPRVPSYKAGSNFVSPQYLMYRHPPALPLPQQWSNWGTSRKGDSKQNVAFHKSQRMEPMDVCLGANSLFSKDKGNESVFCSVQHTDKDRSKSLLFKKFRTALNKFDKEFYNSSFTILTANSPESRRENGVSFVLSGMFMYLALIALSQTVDYDTRRQMSRFHIDDFDEEEKIELLKSIKSWLPNSNSKFKFRWSTRLMLDRETTLYPSFTEGLAPALELKTGHFNQSYDVNEVAELLNRMVESDSGGALRDTFDAEDVSDGVKDVLLSTIYFRCRWRTPPTLLNGTAPFRDHSNRSTPMFRVNDVVNYADVTEWDAEVIELKFSVEGLSLMLVVPRSESLSTLAGRLTAQGVSRALRGRMRALRANVALPLYTLRMTLLLPNKMRELGISRMFPVADELRSDSSELRLTQAVQRVMFWSEAGRNAFKDDGIQWDEPPEMDIFVDRPYIFFVKWKNITILSGNFVL